MDHIAAINLKMGKSDFLPADAISKDRAVAALGERTFDILVRAEQIVPLTRERFAMYSARRPAGSPWPPVGFTEAFLVEKGIIDKPRGKVVVETPRITHIERTDEAVAVGDYFYQPKKIGKFTNYDVIKADGELLRDKAFRKADDAQRFLEELFTKPADTDTSAVGQGGDDDRDVSGKSGDGEG